MKKLVVLLILAAAGLLVWQNRGLIRHSARSLLPENSNIIQGAFIADLGGNAEVVAEGLDMPWEIVFLPDGDLLVAERSGKLKRIGGDEITREVHGLEELGEIGLLGLALHPSFVENGLIYLYIETKVRGKRLDRVDRYRLEADQLKERTTILQNIPGSGRHKGGRLAFGTDRKLYVSTGDAEEAFLAQDRNSLSGKVLRLEDDGRIPQDNPYGNMVWSYGHHDVRGLAWESDGTLWVTERGRQGIASGYDEVNRIEKGGNYGWPIIEGGEKGEGLHAPFEYSGKGGDWGPGGAVHWKGSVLFGGARGEALYQMLYDEDDDAELVAHFHEELGQIMAVRLGPSDNLYLSTVNRDGSGRVRDGDDKIIRVHLDALKLPEHIRKRFR